MKLYLDVTIANQYKSTPQKTRVFTENWVNQEIFCPACGADIIKFENNRPAADFYCEECKEEYELKSKRNIIGNKIVDGAYQTTIERLESHNNPNLFLLNYNPKNYEITNFFVVPKYFFIPEIIEKRNPLSATARRAGWTGCNILLSGIPQSGKIFYIDNHLLVPKEQVLQSWQKTLFLKKEGETHRKTWIIDIMNCVEKLKKKEFALKEMYAFIDFLQVKHPGNHHVKDKIRQQLQYLRDKGYLEFSGNGKYRML